MVERVGDDVGFAVTAPDFEALSGLAELRRVTGPLGTMGCAREKCASSSWARGFEAPACWCWGLCLENLLPGADDDALFLLVIRASRRGVDSGFDGSRAFAQESVEVSLANG